MALLGGQGRRRLARLAWGLLRLGRAGSGRATGSLVVWTWWDALLHRRQRLEAPRPGAMACYTRGRRHGAPVVLRDGTVIKPGDVVLEMHINNRQQLAQSMGGRTPWQRLAATRADMRALAELVASDALGPVVALHGVTLVGGIPRLLGFEIHPLPRTWQWALFRYFMIGEEAIYHPTGLARLDRPRERRWPVECWMSRSSLLRQHGRRGGQDDPPHPIER
jgi:peptidoglycan-N-acetylglucosamine deacetylase